MGLAAIWAKYEPCNVNMRLGVVWMKRGAALLPLSCVTMEALKFEKVCDFRNILGQRRHWCLSKALNNRLDLCSTCAIATMCRVLG